MHVRKRASDRDRVVGHQLRHLMNILQASTCSSQSASDLLHKDGACNASATDFTTLLSAHTAVVCHNDHLGLNAGSFGFLNRHAEVEHVAGIVHDHNEHAFAL